MVSSRHAPLLLVVGVAAAVGFALWGPHGAPASEPASPASASPDPSSASLPAGHPPMGDNGALPPGHPAVGNGSGDMPPGHPAIDNGSGDMPPGHPAVGDMGSAMPSMGASDEAAAIRWTMPTVWKTAKSPSAMRLATYAVPAAAGDTESTEVSIIRAGGSAQANIERWIGQFDDAGKDERSEKTVHGFKVSIVEVQGTYQGGMGPESGSHPHWALLGAIVETPGSSYFFKMTGPAKTVASARKPFQAMLDSIKPAQ